MIPTRSFKQEPASRKISILVLSQLLSTNFTTTKEEREKQEQADNPNCTNPPHLLCPCDNDDRIVAYVDDYTEIVASIDVASIIKDGTECTDKEGNWTKKSCGDKEDDGENVPTNGTSSSLSSSGMTKYQRTHPYP